MNLLINPNFTQHIPCGGGGQVFEGWTQEPECLWMHSGKPNQCENSAAKMGQDSHANGTVTGWMVGDTGILYQGVDALDPHTQVTLSTVEIHHMYSGVVELTLYGWDGVVWVEIFFRPAPDFPINTPANRTTWYPRSYVISSEHTRYKVEFYGQLSEPNDGWKFSCVDVSVS